MLHLERMVRKAVREELEGVRPEKRVALSEMEIPGAEIPEPEIPGEMLDFLSWIE